MHMGHAMQFFKPPKIETILMFVVSVCTSKFSRFQTKSSHIVAYEFHQCGLFNLKTKDSLLLFTRLIALADNRNKRH